MAKTSKKTASAASDEGEQLSGTLRDGIVAGAVALREQIGRATKAANGKKYNQAAVSHLAWLLKQAAQVLDSVRKAEAADDGSLRKLSRARVMAWLRQREPEERAHIIRELQAMDRGGSILS